VRRTWLFEPTDRLRRSSNVAEYAISTHLKPWMIPPPVEHSEGGLGLVAVAA